MTIWAGGGSDWSSIPSRNQWEGAAPAAARMESPPSLDPDPGAEESLVAPLLELGIPEAAARRVGCMEQLVLHQCLRALALTGGHSAEAAAQLYFSSSISSQIAAQVAHAAVALFQLMQEKSTHRDMINQWDEHGAKKVVLQGANTDQLLELHALALSLELPTYVVQDAGRTQVPAGSHTVLAIMGEEEMVNQVTGTLKLLS